MIRTMLDKTTIELETVERLITEDYDNDDLELMTVTIEGKLQVPQDDHFFIKEINFSNFQCDPDTDWP